MSDRCRTCELRWVHPSRQRLPIGPGDWVAAPACLDDFRRCWDGPNKRIVVAFVDHPTCPAAQLPLETEDDYQNVLKMVLDGEPVMLSVAEAPEETGGAAQSPPEWFTSYMNKFRTGLLAEMEQLVERKLQQLSVPTTPTTPVCPLDPEEPELLRGSYDACILSDDATLHAAVGQPFAHTWTLKNIGELPWDGEMTLRLAHATAGLLAESTQVSVPPLQPGEEGNVVIQFDAPPFPGLFETFWHLYHQSERFGPWLRCVVSVDPISADCDSQAKGVQDSITSTSSMAVVKEMSPPDDDDDQALSDSDASSTFEHVPMPPCYRFDEPQSAQVSEEADPATKSVVKQEEVEAEEESPMPEANASAPASERASPEADSSCADEPEQTPSQPEPERDSSPVRILPQGLMAGASFVASRALSGAEAFVRTIHAASPAPAPEADVRTRNLISLSEMGFLDERLNTALLDRYHDHLDRVVADLLLR